MSLRSFFDLPPNWVFDLEVNIWDSDGVPFGDVKDWLNENTPGWQCVTGPIRTNSGITWETAKIIKFETDAHAIHFKMMWS